MERKLLIIMTVVIILFTGCSKSVKDDITKYDLPVLESSENDQITHVIGHDGMHRSIHYPADSELVIDSTYYNKKEIIRGDVVYYKTAATEDQIKKGQGYEYDIARVIGMPNETLFVKKGQVYINNNKLDTFYGKEYYIKGFIDGTNEAHSTEKEINISEGQYFLAGDVWWRSGFHSNAIPKSEIRGKIIGVLKKMN